MKSNNDKIKQSLIPTLVKNDSPIKTTPDKNKRLNTPSSCLSDSNSKRSGIPVSIPSKKIIIVEIDPESHILKPTVASKVASIKGIEEEIIGFASPPIIFNEERLIRLTKPTESAVLGAIKYENDKLLVKDEDDPWWEIRKGKNSFVKVTPPKNLQNVSSKYQPSLSSSQTKVDKVLTGKQKIEKDVETIMNSKCNVIGIDTNSHLLVPTESAKRHSKYITETDNISKEDNLIKIQDLFKLMDMNDNGTLDKSELFKVLKILKNDKDPTTLEVDKCFEIMDTNGDGVIDIKEFTTGILSYQMTIKKMKLTNNQNNQINLIHNFELSEARQLSLKTGPKDVKSRLSVEQIDRHKWRSKEEEDAIKKAMDDLKNPIIPSKKINPKDMSPSLINPSPVWETTRKAEKVEKVIDKRHSGWNNSKEEIIKFGETKHFNSKLANINKNYTTPERCVSPSDSVVSTNSTTSIETNSKTIISPYRVKDKDIKARTNSIGNSISTTTTSISMSSFIQSINKVEKKEIYKEDNNNQIPVEDNVFNKILNPCIYNNDNNKNNIDIDSYNINRIDDIRIVEHVFSPITNKVGILEEIKQEEEEEEIAKHNEIYNNDESSDEDTNIYTSTPAYDMTVVLLSKEINNSNSEGNYTGRNYEYIEDEDSSLEPFENGNNNIIDSDSELDNIRGISASIKVESPCYSSNNNSYLLKLVKEFDAKVSSGMNNEINNPTSNLN